MSGFHTHMLIGGVAGLALFRALPLFGGSAALGISPIITQQAGGVALALPLIMLSALLATIPDIDEPGSFIARRVHTVVTLAGVGLAAFTAYAAQFAPLMWALAGVAGAVLGSLAGHVLLRLIRRGAGGHRRFTHSLVLAGGLALVAGAMWRTQLGAWAIIPGALAWGIIWVKPLGADTQKL